MTGAVPALPAADDADLVARARGGDAAAFDTVFARYHDRVYNLAVRLVGNRDDAADIAQAAFVRAYGSLARLRDGQAFLGWVYRIVVNLVRDRHRAQRRRPWVALLDLWRPDRRSERGEGAEPVEFADSSLDPARLAVSKGRTQALQAAIQQLPLESREVVVLHHLEGLDVRTIARVTSVPEGTVKSRLGRARHRLRAALAAWLDEGDEEK